MTRKILIPCFLLIGLLAKAQTVNLREQVYLHLNSSSFITGETMYFSAYTTSMETGLVSSLSSLLYVELISKEGKPVFQQKIRLEKGLGQGDFFISSLIPTGTYQLLAYTRWMKNFGDYFESSITVVNPFEEYEIPDTKNGEPMADFYPESGALITGKENTLALVTKNFQPGTLKGKIVNTDGETANSFELTANEISHFTFIPRPGQTYQAILEDQSGDFYFFNLPGSSSDKIGIHLETRKNTYEITPVASSEKQNLAVIVKDAQNTLFAKPAISNSTITISKEHFKQGIYQIVVEENGEPVANRLLYHQVSVKTTDLVIPQSTYGLRSEVSIPLEAPSGNYSVSVRSHKTSGNITDLNNTWIQGIKKPDYAAMASLSGLEEIDGMIYSASSRGTSDKKETVEFLPELRGELISGHLQLPGDLPMEEQVLSYSIMGKDFQIQTTHPEANGDFTFQIQPFDGEQTAVVTVIDGPEQYTLSVDDPFLAAYPDFDFAPVVIDSATAAELAKRSVRNQIENAYYEMKEDSITTASTWISQFGDFNFFYTLDEFNRFPQLYEYFIEYVPTVVARNNKHNSKIKVLVNNPLPAALEPLVMLDGVPVKTEEILNFSPYRIETIGVVNHRFFLGSLVSDGVVSLHTYEGNLQGFRLPASALKTDYQGIESRKLYTFPDYSSEATLTRIPDFREQLYWNPAIHLEKGAKTIKFYSSDVEGDFDVIVEGFTDEGLPVHMEGSFTIEATPN